MPDEIHRVAMQIPIDDDGFVRQKCPTCDREFKRLRHEESEESGEPELYGFYCPYCAIQSSGNWLTDAQTEQLRAIALRDVAQPTVEGLLRKTFGSSVKFTPNQVEMPAPLAEAADMQRVDFDCHPSEPVKVLDGWAGPVHCRICGTAAS
jgi:hypothetical protein